MKKHLSKIIGSVLIVGIYLFLAVGSSDSGSTSYQSSDSHNNHNEKERCGWCGGVGQVGYAGESEEQFRRTGMGKGNVCMRCKGSGYTTK